MGWYDWFSVLYDPALEPLYRPYRKRAAEALQVVPGSVVLDVPCGTGQSFAALHGPARPGGGYVGVDLSAGMLDRARRRTRGEEGAHLLERDAGAITAEVLQSVVGREDVDRLHVFLGSSVLPDWPGTFAALWALVRPGGRVVLVDVHSEELSLQGRWVEWMARADLSRKGWEPLQAVAEHFERTELSTDAVHGGTLWMATGDKRG
ncbi:MAG: methyltransferase domain-containing protein [Myxococcales bacterium]|nr:methyltransferase domain-containing protein [Myxococcales bacterium]